MPNASAGKTLLNDAVEGALDLVYPPRCVLCDTFGPAYLCESCASQIPVDVPPPVCERCGRHCDSLPCAECLGDPPYFVIAVAAGEYSGLTQEAVHWLKYRDRPMLAEPLGLILAAYARRERARLADLSFDAVVPVPMHPARGRVRGYNHAERLARVVGHELNIPIRPELLRRVRATRPQVGLDADTRRSNLDGAFRADSNAVNGLSLLVIDDVSTTGSTNRETAKTLKLAGAKAVYCLCLAAD